VLWRLICDSIMESGIEILRLARLEISRYNFDKIWFDIGFSNRHWSLSPQPTRNQIRFYPQKNQWLSLYYGFRNSGIFSPEIQVSIII
jgi:hypothetical protein